jgi:exoribonuclease R
MEEYIIEINNRAYTDYAIYNVNTNEKFEKYINPVDNKLFNGDSFILCTFGIKITKSEIRNRILPGLLVVDKTYGRENKIKEGQTYSIKSLGRLLYKFVPYDNRIPSFLVPYEIKHLDFSKTKINLYVLVKFNNWDDKHPYGSLTQVIGKVNELDNYYEYQLYCKELNKSIQNLTNITNKKLLNISVMDEILNKYSNINDRTDWKTFTIDPESCLDYDDAFSIRSLDDNNKMISIYISNVPLILDYLNLWSSLTDRVSTIYLPNRKKPMLPLILSDDLCSLIKSKNRLVFTLDLIINENFEIISLNYSNNLIKIKNNYVYEELKLLNNNDYINLLVTVREMNKKYKFVNEIKDSHELVAYLMILMNYNVAKSLSLYNNGIFRMTSTIEHGSMPTDVIDNLKFLNNPNAEYINSEITPIGPHIYLELDAYVHITSPIRRLVDVLNMIKMQKNLNLLTLSEYSETFYSNWKLKICKINEDMRKIKSVQNNCNLLDMIENNKEMLDEIYDGYILDKLTNSYSVYISELKLIAKCNSEEELDKYSLHKFKLYMFIDEDNFYKKIRLMKLQV